MPRRPSRLDVRVEGLGFPSERSTGVVGALLENQHIVERKEWFP